jgi:hypothetical protein
MVKAEKNGASMDQQKKVIPVFNSEQEEREFWTSHDSSEYIDWDKAAPAIFPDLKPTFANDSQPPQSSGLKGSSRNFVGDW